MSTDKEKELEERRARLSPEKRALLEQRLRGVAPAARHDRIPKRSESGPCRLSFPQAVLWFLEGFAGSLSAYNIPLYVRLRGRLDASILRRSLLGIVERHEVLRTRFASGGGRPYQEVLPALEFPWREEDLTGISPETREGEALHRADAASRQSFDLGSAPLLRGTLYRLSSDEHMLCLVVHHIVFDGWSVGILLRELAAHYEALSRGEVASLSPLPIQYGDYAAWQREWFGGEALDRSLAYWRERLRAPVPVLELPTDHPRPAVQTFVGGEVRRRLSRRLTERLRAFSQHESVTLFVTLLSCWGVLLHRYTGDEDLVTGSAIAGRTREELEGLIGFFVNTLALRLDLSGEPSFREVLRRTQQVALEAYEHQETPFEAVVAALQPERALSRSPLIQVMFVFHNTPAPVVRFCGVEASVEGLHNGGAKFDLTFAITDHAEGLRLSLEYNRDLFDASTAIRMLDHYETLLEGAVSEPEARIYGLALMTPDERKLVIETWNATTRPYPRESSLGALFAEQASLTPDLVALEFEGARLTYRELNARANRLAHYLRRMGVGPEVLVGLCAERSVEMVVGTLAIIKAGGAYVPLDPEYPASRLSYMLEDTGAPVVLTQKELLERLPSRRPLWGGSDRNAPAYVCLDDEAAYAGESEDEPESGAGASSLAYVMYTSGSTGQPKGVCVEHRNVVRLVKNTDYARMAGEVFLQFAPASFDAATLEIWGPLLNGGRLVVYRPGPTSLEELGTAVERSGITTLWLTSGLFHQMVEHQLESLRGVRQLMSGGDVLSVAHCRRVLETLPETTLINGYGPTECTTFTCCYPMKSVEALGETVSIGRPIANTRVYILDRHMEPVPVGVWGELYVGGDGVARGYLNAEELTAERFVRDPFSGDAGGRLYKTGDVVRWLADGRIEFQGRMDFQVKLRGFRVELGEIESVLNRHSGVGESVVLLREDTPGDKRLVGYVVRRGGEAVEGAALRVFLKEQLPDYMAPSAIMFLESFPLTANGKVDRRALPAPTGVDLGVGGVVEPRTSVERALAEIWRAVLKVDRLSIHDNFFDLGGHSLLATQVISQIRDSLGVAIPLRTLFDAQTIATLAERVGAHLAAESAAGQPKEAAGDPCVVALQSEGGKTPFFCATGAGAVVGYYGPLASCFADDRPFYGLQDPRLDEADESFPSVEDLAARLIQAIRTVQPQGPYFLGGWSFGGIVAFEMALQLQRQGEVVAFLGLIDTGAPSRQADSPKRSAQLLRRPAKKLLRWGRMLFTMRGTILGYIGDAARLALAVLLGKRDPAASHLTARDYLRWAKFDLSTQYNIALGGLTGRDARRARLTLIHEPFVWHVFKTTLARSRAVSVYQVTPYTGRITLLRAESGLNDLSEDDTTLGWSGVPDKGLDVRVIPGNHGVILRKPYVDRLASELRKSLDAADPRQQSFI